MNIIEYIKDPTRVHSKMEKLIKSLERASKQLASDRRICNLGPPRGIQDRRGHVSNNIGNAMQGMRGRED